MKHSLDMVRTSSFLQLKRANYFLAPNALWYTCPYTSATPVPPDISSQNNSDGLQELLVAILLPTIVSGVCLLACLIVGATWYTTNRRRKYYNEEKQLQQQRKSAGEKHADDNYEYREIDFADLTVGRELGRGAFGRVYKVCNITMNDAFRCIRAV